MSGINPGRLIGSGLAASLVVWLLDWAGSLIYHDRMQAVVTHLGLSLEMDPTMQALSVVASIILGFAMVFFYAAARPRFGPGPGSALLVAVTLWASTYLVSLIGYHMLGLYPVSILLTWGGAALVKMVAGGLVGAWVYREALPV